MKKEEITEREKKTLLGGLTEVRILGERACGGITGDITIREDKIVISFAQYVEAQQNGKWFREENHDMPFTKNFAWVDGNLVIQENKDTVVVVHQSLESIVAKLS